MPENIALPPTVPDRLLDVRGQSCPYPLIMIKKALAELEPGQVLEVESDYEPTVRTTIPVFCQKKGYPVEVQAVGKQTWRIRIHKNV